MIGFKTTLLKFDQQGEKTGWTYINIDDAWQGVRSGRDTALQPNEKFPNIKEMFFYGINKF